MAKRGRPVRGANLVESVAASGSPLAKARLKVILRTLAGELTVAQACGCLGIGRSAFNKLRSQFLARAAGLLEPRPAGRRRRVPTAAELEAERLRQENAGLRLDLKAQQIREELAVVMPHLLKPVPRDGRNVRRKKGAPRTSSGPRRGGSGSSPA